MEFRQLRYFVEIAKEQNLSRAAIKLHVSQPALSIQIKQLEESLGVPIFDRTGKGVRLTEAGSLLLHHAQRILLQVEEAERCLSELNDLQRGHLSIGVIQSVNACIMPEAISRFRLRYPGIFLQISELPGPEIERQVESAKLALGISFLPQRAGSFDTERLFADELVLLVNKSHRLRNKKFISIEMLRGEPLISFPKDYATRTLLDKMFEQKGERPNVILETNTIQAILMAAKKTGTATIIPSLVLTLAEARQLHSIRLTPAGSHERPVALLWQKSSVRRRSAQAFAAVLRDVINEKVQ
jgi:LysR family transcriptional regulator, cyn operon transcriptional activator